MPSMLDPMIDQGAIAALAEGRHGDPFAVLGPHDTQEGRVVRAFLPGAHAVTLIDDKGATLAPMDSANGMFEGALPAPQPYRLRIDWGGGIQETHDPYSFPPLLGEMDIYLLKEGRQLQLAECLGAKPMQVNGVDGVRFAVWAPNARRVSVIGPFNIWDGRRHPMRLRVDAGVWEIFIPRIGAGEIYKYEILARDGAVIQKADPVARAVEVPPATASIVDTNDAFTWTDDAWRQAHRQRQPNTPLSIYEVHAPSWRRHPDGRSYTWNELGDSLIPYVTDLGFTHIELLPIMAYPFGGSWGYQPLSQFAPLPAMGQPADFARFIDRCHEAGIGVILDWVPAHFPTDSHGLIRFDGTALYEHEDPREGFHQDWNTLIYNLGRAEVRNFLLASALFWLNHFHADAIRVDAVASMLYRDYSRKADEWIPNRYGGRENLESISFFRELRGVIDDYAPGALMIAEESTAFPGVTATPQDGGLGFTHKWNMGWMHDTLRYIQEDPVNRRYHHDDLTFGLIYAFSEHFVLPISHDEVVHGKYSLLGRMPGDHWQRFANLRIYLAYLWTQPGKKLLFMGCEFGQQIEWNHDQELSWYLLQDSMHQGVLDSVRDLNRIYAAEPALHAGDFSPEGFRWVIGDDRAQSVVACLRLDPAGAAPPVLVVYNFTPVPRYGYRIGVPHGGAWREILNTDAAIYGGSNLGNSGMLTAQSESAHGLPHSLDLLLPPLAALVLRWEG